MKRKNLVAKKKLVKIGKNNVAQRKISEGISLNVTEEKKRKK